MDIFQGNMKQWHLIAIIAIAVAALILVVVIIMIIVWSKKDKKKVQSNIAQQFDPSDYDKTVAFRPQPQQFMNAQQQKPQSVPPQMPQQPIQSAEAQDFHYNIPQSEQRGYEQPMREPINQPLINNNDIFEDSLSQTDIMPAESENVESDKNIYDDYDATVVLDDKPIGNLEEFEEADEYEATMLADTLPKEAFRVTRSIIVIHTEEVIY